MTMPTVVYIVGMGRSGSTLLDIALGQSVEVQSCGELSNFTDAVAKRHPCACGAVVSECDYWKGIVNAELPHRSVDDAAWNHARKASSWLRVLFSARAKEYAARQDSLYRSISVRSGRSFVVDSSKSPLRLALLMRWSTCSIRVVHLVRDPAAVADSLAATIRSAPEKGVQQTLNGKPRLRTYLAWGVINTLAELVLRFVPATHRLRVRYEDLLAHPGETVQKIAAMLRLKDSAFGNFEDVPLDVGHLVAGNRMRMGEVRIRKSATGAGARRPQSPIGELITVPMRARYNYGRSEQ